MDSAMNTPSPSSSTGSTSTSRSTSPNPPHQSSSFPPSLPPGLAALVTRKMISLELIETGFEAAEEEAVEFLEGTLNSFFESLIRTSHDFAELGRRHEPNMLDVVKGCIEMGLIESPKELTEQASRRDQISSSTPLDLSIRYARSTRRHHEQPPALLPSDDESPAFPDPDPDPAFDSPPPSPPSQALSATDEDSDAEFEEVLPLGADGQPIPTSEASAMKDAKDLKKKEKALRKLEKESRQKERERRRAAREFRKKEYGKTFEGDWMPRLPPKHSWKQTPVFPEQPPPPPIPAPVSRTVQSPSTLALSHLSTLRSRLNDSQLVASSLRNLIRRTGSAARGNGNGGTVSTMTMTELTTEEAANAAEVVAEQEADLISYENEWYGSNKTIQKSLVRNNFAGRGGKRNVRIIKVSDRRKREGVEEGESSGDEGEGREGREGMSAGGGGGVAKRRRWLV
ncbi:uncharacterized protein JCM6883_002377 [Sporobolomyces salmoneus]|uniref:uncharacterized protein n=1 Tax=Sporobolomyces salmoneus TaxID=183962 RepID=UPI00317682BE